LTSIARRHCSPNLVLVPTGLTGFSFGIRCEKVGDEQHIPSEAGGFIMSDNVVPTATAPTRVNISSTKSHGSLDADIIIKNAPDPVFVSDLEGKILSANDAPYTMLAFRTDDVLEQSLSRFISPEETPEFTAYLREVSDGRVIRNPLFISLRRPRQRSPPFPNASLFRSTVVPAAAAPARLNISSDKAHGSLDADIIIKNAPDPVFVSDLE